MKKLILILIMLLLVPIRVNAMYASAYIVMDTDNGRVLEGSNIHSPHLIASITKIMTAIVVINNTDIKRNVTIGKEVLKSYGSGIYVEVGENISIENLLYGLMLRSGNDAAIALAYAVSGSMEDFVKLMNDTAASIGMKNTIFLNSHGLEESNGKGNTSTAYDMALLTSYAYQNKDYQKIAGTKSHTVKTDKKTYVWTNKNKLLNMYEYSNGGKTGYTEKAGRTLVTTASKDNINLTVVTFRDGNDFNDHKNLYIKNFDKHQSYEILKIGKYSSKYKDTILKESFKMSLTKEEYKAIKSNLEYYEKRDDNSVGEVKVSLYNKLYFKGKVFAEEEKKQEEKKLSFWQKLLRFFGG